MKNGTNFEALEQQGALMKYKNLFAKISAAGVSRILMLTVSVVVISISSSASAASKTKNTKSANKNTSTKVTKQSKQKVVKKITRQQANKKITKTKLSTKLATMKVSKSLKPAVASAPTLRAPTGLSDSQRELEIRGQSRNLSMMLVLKNRHENIDFVKPRDTYRDEIQQTSF